MAVVKIDEASSLCGAVGSQLVARCKGHHPWLLMMDFNIFKNRLTVKKLYFVLLDFLFPSWPTLNLDHLGPCEKTAGIELQMMSMIQLLTIRLGTRLTSLLFFAQLPAL